MYLSLAHESRVIKKTPKTPKSYRKTFSCALSAQEVPGKLLHGLLSGAASQGSGSPANPRGGLRTLCRRIVPLAARGAGADAGDTDTMAARMGHEGTVASTAAQLHAGLSAEARGRRAEAVTAASGARVWVVMLPRAPINAGVPKSKMGREGLCYSRLERNGRSLNASSRDPHPQIGSHFTHQSFLCLLKCLGH